MPTIAQGGKRAKGKGEEGTQGIEGAYTFPGVVGGGVDCRRVQLDEMAQNL